MTKIKEKSKAIELRKQGLSYSEILRVIPVARSTLSLWLRGVNLSKPQKQRLTKKKRKAQRRGAEKVRVLRIKKVKKLKREGIKEIGKVGFRDLWIAGTALYWGEGTKQSERNVSQCVSFSNSDPKMIKLFIEWLLKICKIKKKKIKLELYLHISSKDKKEKIISFWSNELRILKNKLKVYWKRSKIKRSKKIGSYFGTIRVKVIRSTDLNRKINGWVEALYKNYWGVV